MKKVSHIIVKHPTLILIIALLLLIPAYLGIKNTAINYDILSYLPDNMNSTEAQKIIEENFSDVGSTILIVDSQVPKEVMDLKKEVKKIDGVKTVVWIDDFVDVSIPKSMLPTDIKDIFYSGNSTLLFISFTEGEVSEKTHQAIDEIREVVGNQGKLAGMGSIVKDTKDLADKEKPFYVAIAVLISIIILALTLKSTIIPLIFMTSIGLAIAFNMGTNHFLGEISYITSALAAVLQLGVTMDFSIFLLHRFDEELKKGAVKEDAMAHAIVKTFSSITGSSLTTIASFLALVTMELTLGRDIGIVMAKGVLLGVLCTIIILPCLILTFNTAIHKYSHQTILPSFEKLSTFVCKHYRIFIGIFIISLLPAIYGKVNTQVYYNLINTLPNDMDSIIATNQLKDDYGMSTTHFILIDDQLQSYRVNEMVNAIKELDGIERVMSVDEYIGPGIPSNFLPDELTRKYANGGYKLILVNSNYLAAEDKENIQIDNIRSIINQYDPKGVVGGEGPLTKDLVDTSDRDFKRVSIASIFVIFVIIMIVFKSVTIPVLLVASIQFAIFINMGIPYYTGSIIPFISSIVIGCIQLGATVDYAILLTTRFKEELQHGKDKITAMKIAIQQSGASIVTSGFTLFGATMAVALISDLSIITSLCSLIARGAIVSMLVILFILPSFLIVFERLIDKTTIKWSSEKKASPSI